MQIFRNGVLVSPCTDTTGATATPDPCIARRQSLPDGDVAITVLTSHFSTWNAATITSYDLHGFYQPVDMRTDANPKVTNTVKAGATVPLKFELFAGSTELTSPALVTPTARPIDCTTGTEDAVEVTASGNTTLRYDSTAGQFVYNWKTPTAKGCYTVTIAAKNGSSITAHFNLK